MLVNVNGIYYVHVCEQARWARLAGNSATENVCTIIITTLTYLAVVEHSPELPPTVITCMQEKTRKKKIHWGLSLLVFIDLKQNETN